MASNIYLCANRSSKIREMEGKQAIGMLKQYYYQVMSKSDQVIQVCGSTLFNQKYISLHELYLELPQAPRSTSCITINSVSSNSDQDSSILNIATILSFHGVNPHLGIKHLTKMAVSPIRYTSTNF